MFKKRQKSKNLTEIKT